MNHRPFIRRPLVGTAAAAAAGMASAASGLIPPAVFFPAAALCILLAVCFIRHQFSTGFVLLAVALTAACRFVVGHPSLPEHSINRYGRLIEHQPVQLTGRISGMPRFRSADPGGPGTWTFAFQCKELEVSKVWKPVSGTLDARLYDTPSEMTFRSGDELRMNGVISRRDFPGMNELEFNGSGAGCAVIKPAGEWSLRRAAEDWRASAAARLDLGLEEFSIQASVLKALVLGYRENVPKETVEVFKRTGSMHIFAISGLHVGIVGLLLALVLKVLGVPRGKMGLVLIPLLGMYVVSTGMKSSALRALLMAVVFLAAPLFRRRPDIPTSVALAALVLLLFQPLEILAPGFIFSFTVVIFLVMIYAAIPASWVQGSWVKRYSVSLAVTSAAAGAVAIPMAALFFGNFAPIALVGNLLVVPLTFCIVLCGWLSILVPPASIVFNAAAAVFIQLLLESVQVLDRIPGSSFRVETPPLLAVLMWYGGLIALFTHCRRRSEKYAAAGFAALGLLLVLLG